jgi:hypothetical protein
VIFWLVQVFQATSPSGRFVDGAIAINGRVLSHIEAHGKNIFYVRNFCYLSLSLSWNASGLVALHGLNV